MHSDVVGQLPRCLTEAKYFVAFVEQFFRYSHVACMFSKKNVLRSFKLFKSLPDIEKIFGNGVLQLHTDGKSEYLSIDCIFESTTSPDTPQHNHFAERINHTILDLVGTVLE